MGKVNVVLPGGRVVAVDEDVALKAQGNLVHTESTTEAEQRIAEEKRHEAYGDFGGKYLAAAEGAADTLTFGLAGKAVSAVGGERAQRVWANAAEENPGYHTAGEFGAFFLPGSELAAPGIAARAGEATGSKLAGRIVEGSMFGAGAHVAQSTITGDPLTIEGTLEDAGIGALLNVGMGAAGDKILGIGKRAQEGADEAAVIKKHVTTVKAGRELFDNPPESWSSFTDAVEGKAATQRELFADAEKATEAYEKFTGSSAKMDAAFKSTERTINKISGYWRDANVPDTLLNTEGEELTPQSGSVGRKPPISEDMQARLKDFRDRLRSARQTRAGGWDVEGTQKAGKWVKDPAAVGDAKGAIENLRALQDDLRKQFPTAAEGMTEIPAAPPSLTGIEPPVKADLPDTLLGFARKKPETIEKIANLVKDDPSAQEAVMKVAKELGMNPEDGLAGIHAGLGKYIEAEAMLKKLAAKAAEDEQSGGVLSFVRSSLKKFVRYGAARAADTALGGGWLGAAGRVVAGEGTSLGMSAAEDTIIGGTLLKSKMGVQSKVKELVAKWAIPTGNAVKKLGPAMSYLGQSFPSGEPDPEKDVRKQARNRVNDIMHAQLTAGDSAFLALQPFLGHESDAGWKMHSQILNAVNHLAAMAPKDPSAPTLVPSNWLPTLEEARALAHRLEAALAPLNAAARQLTGMGHPAGAESLHAMWPAMAMAIGQEMASRPDLMMKVPMTKGGGHSELLRAPLSPLQDPGLALAFQQLYEPSPPQQQQSARPNRRTGNPTGRPAAVQSQVAGANVANLIA